MPSYEDDDDDVLELNENGVFDLSAPSKKQKQQEYRAKIQAAGERVGEVGMTPETLVEGNKTRGNEAFASKDYDGAIDHYTSAISMADKCGIDAVPLRCNRALAKLKKGGPRDLKGCIQDCDEALKVDEGCLKALYRKAQALQELGKAKQAIEVLTAASKVAPADANVSSLLKKLQLSQEKKARPASSWDQESRYICIQALAMSAQEVNKLAGSHQATIRRFREDPDFELLRQDAEVQREVKVLKERKKMTAQSSTGEATYDPKMVEACRAAVKMSAEQVRELPMEQRNAVEQLRLAPYFAGLRQEAAEMEKDHMMAALNERNKVEEEERKERERKKKQRQASAPAEPPAPPPAAESEGVAAAGSSDGGDDGDNSGDKTEKERPIYIASEQFEGRKEGYVFKKGAQGVGYYIDRRGGGGKGAAANAAASSSYYHFDSKGNKFKNKWDSYDVDEELEKLDEEDGSTSGKAGGSSSQSSSKKEGKKKEQKKKQQTRSNAVDEDDLTFDPDDEMYKDVPPDQQHAIRMALSVTEEQMKQMPEKEQEMLKQFRQVHKQRKRAAREEARRKDMVENPQNYGDEGVAAATKAKMAKEKASEEKDPEKKLEKHYSFLGTDKKWSSMETPVNKGDNQARCAAEELMIEETKKEKQRLLDREAQKQRLRKYKEGGAGQTLAQAGQKPGGKSSTAKGATEDPTKLLNKITKTVSADKRKKGKKKAKKEKSNQLAAIRKMAKAKSSLDLELG